MEKENILECGRDGLYQLKEELRQLEDCKGELMQREQEELERKEKSIQEEIQLEVRKRENEIGMSYDEQINRFKARKKKVQAKKDKSKSIRISERILLETSELAEENRKLNEEIKAALQEGGISKAYNNRLYYALFAPKGLSDIGIIMLTAVLLAVALPKLLLFAFFSKAGSILTVLIYLIVWVVFGGLYYLVFARTKAKNGKAIANGKEIRYRMRKNAARIRHIKKEIRQDRDESQYDLDGFNEEIKEFEEKINELAKQKAEALAVLRNTTSHLITEGVHARHAEGLAELREEFRAVYEENKRMEDQVNEMTMYMANTYELYLGKSCMNVSAINEMLSFMEEEQLDTVGEALQRYKSCHPAEEVKQSGKGK